MYRGADKSLARSGRKQARKHVKDARDFNNIETRAVIKFFCKQGAERNSRHSDRNISLFPSLSGEGLISIPVQLLTMYFSPLPSYLVLLRPKYSRSIFSNTLSLCSALNLSDQVSHPYKTTGKIIIQNYHNTAIHITNILRPVFRPHSVFVTLVQLTRRIEIILQR